jgi:cyclohexadienyl dehydratase
VTRRPIELYVALLVCVGNACADAIPVADCEPGGRNVLAEIRSRGTLRVAHSNDYRPFTFRSADQSSTGIDADLAQRLAADLHVSLEWVDTTWSTLTADLQANRFDIAMSGVSITPERARAGCFTTAYFTTGKTALRRCALNRTFDTLAQIDNPDVTVIVNPGGTNERFVHEHLPNARIVVHADNRTIFGALASGEGDVMITDAVEARLEAQANPALCVSQPPVLFETVEKAYLIPKDPVWRDWLDRWLANLRRSGDIETITRRYLEAPQPTQAAPNG